MDPKAIAREYIAQWDTWDAIVQTASLGLADEDKYMLRQVYTDEEAEAIGAEIVHLCRVRIDRGKETP